MRMTVPAYDDGTFEEPDFPYEVVEENYPHNVVLEVEDDDAPMTFEDLVLSVNSFAELKQAVQRRRDRRRPAPGGP